MVKFSVPAPAPRLPSSLTRSPAREAVNSSFTIIGLISERLNHEAKLRG
jgi:hypothetical protein